MTEDDLDDVLRIENLSFPQPWTRGMFESELHNPVSSAFVERVAYKGEEVLAGYIVFWMVVGEAHIMNIAVAPELRGMGLAKRLLSFALNYMEQSGISSVFLEVRRSNTAARRLYEKFGFEEAFVRERYYGDEDAIVMRLELKQGSCRGI